jgi:NADH:ubiquinone oxidoreductase subunit H
MLTVLLGFIWRGYVVAKLRYAQLITKAYRLLIAITLTV